LESLIAILAAGELPGKSAEYQSARNAIMKSFSELQTAPGVVAAEIETKKEESKIMDVNELKEKHADLYQAVFEEGKKTGIDEGKIQGAAAEVERVKSVKAVAMPGHEALLETLMFDGKTTGPEAAVMVINAENKKREVRAADIKKDGEEIVVPVVETVEAPKEKKASAGEQLSTIAKEKMASDKTLSFSAALTLAQKENPELANEYAANKV
jgi:hypothetical protein